MSYQDSSTSTSRWRTILDTVATISFVAIAISVTWTSFEGARRGGGAAAAAPRAQRSRPEPSLPTTPQSLDGAAVDGDAKARIAMIVYSDFQCPFCAKFAREVLPTLQDKYVRPGKIQLVFRHFPLSIHPLAQKAAEAAECAGRQGKFWEMHNALFSEPRRLAAADLQTHAAALRLDLHGFERCLAGEAATKVLADVEAGKALVVRGTPTIFLGTVQTDHRVKVTSRLSGAQPISIFETAVASLLKAESN
jgi:protein-disulfide isomerase